MDNKETNDTIAKLALSHVTEIPNLRQRASVIEGAAGLLSNATRAEECLAVAHLIRQAEDRQLKFRTLLYDLNA